MTGIFKTDISNTKELESVQLMLHYHLGYTKIASNRKGRYKTLCVESSTINPPDVVNLLGRMGYYCQPLSS